MFWSVNVNWVLREHFTIGNILAVLNFVHNSSLMSLWVLFTLDNQCFVLTVEGVRLWLL